jgi:predicted dehydrogenase
MSPDPVRVAVVGLGYWGPNLLRNLVELAEAEVVLMCDERPERLAMWGRRYPAIQTTASFSDVLTDDCVDAVAIATPVATHFDLAARALHFGKHVFVEKPLAASSDEAAELVRVARGAHRLLMPGHTFLYSPPVVFIRELIESGALGDLYFVSTSRVNLGLHQPDVSVAWDLGPHDFSILRYWFEETPRYVTATSRCCVLSDVPDVAFITLGYESGAICHVELSWLAPSKLRRTTIVGSEKMLVYDDTSNESVRVYDSGVLLQDPVTFGEYHLSYRTGDIVSPHIAGAEPLLLEMGDLCDAIRLGRPPLSSSDLGIEVVRMIEAVDRSLAADGARIDLAADGAGCGTSGRAA